MKKIAIILCLFLSAGLLAQDMRNNASFSLFSDYKAVRIGDAVTIIVVESSSASNNAQKSTGRNSNINFSANGTMDDAPLIPAADLGISSGNDFNGNGSTKTTGSVNTKIAATIDSVLANGNLRINGSRKIVINGEEQQIHIKGVVRLSDIQADNTVYSYNISSAEIIFEGKGMIDDSQSPGLLTKLFHWVF